jgi:hypothetical protein
MLESILTVLEPATTHDLTTLDTLKQDLGIETNDQDDQLRRVIRSASSAIADYTNRVWGMERVQEDFLPERCTFRNWNGLVFPGIQLKRTPIIEIESITDWGGDLLVAADYQVDMASGVIYRLWDDAFGAWYAPPTQIVYSAGYELLDSLPDAIEQACLDLCRTRWASRGRDPMVRSIDIPGVKRVDYWVGSIGGDGGNPAIPPQVAGLLDRYIRYNV